jgi:protocatechuate 4,5-dioxygenase alpha chain
MAWIQRVGMQPFHGGILCAQPRLRQRLIQDKALRSLPPNTSLKTTAMFARKENQMPIATTRQPVAGTTIFDGEQARKGYALNKMCYSFNDARNRRDFVADEDAYCARYGLNAQQREAIRNRNVLQLIEAGGNAYYLAKFAGIFGLDMQDIGAQQTGMSKEQFKAKLAAAGA